MLMMAKGQMEGCTLEKGERREKEGDRKWAV
jgi:hypothetical protein